MKRLRVGGVAHQPVEDRAEGLGRGEAHVLVGLVDDELHRRQLRGGDARRARAAVSRDLVLEPLERHRPLISSTSAASTPGQRLAGQRVLLGLGQAEPVDPHAGQVGAPHPRVGRADPRVLAGDHEVGAEREVAAAADAPAVDLGDHRLRRAPDAHELLGRRRAPARWRRRSPCPGPTRRRSSAPSSQWWKPPPKS